MKFCTKCGAPIDEDTKFCKKCGNLVKHNIDEKEKQFTEALDKIDINDSGEKNNHSTIDLHKEEHSKKSKLIEKEEPNVQDLSETQEIPIQRLNEHSDYNQPSYNNVAHPKKPKNKFLSGIVPKVIAGLLVIVVILIGVFFNRIEAAYYISKCNNSIDETEKIEYATKAVKALDSSNTKDLLKNTLVEIAKDDVDLAEKDLEKVSSMISQGDYQNIASGIKEKKVDKLCSQGKYQEAFNELNEINKLGGDFKSNKNYEDIMLNVVAKLTNTPVQNTKNLLMDNSSICFDSFDSDPFDEIIELKKNGGYSYNSDIKINLYKCKNGQYKLVDTKVINSAWNAKMQGVYNYDTDKKGVYVSYSTSANSGNTVGTSVYGVSDDKLQLKGTIGANNYTKPEDVNNDGIYEILSNSSSLVSQSGVSKWYRVYDDGKAPTEVKENGGQASKTGTGSNDYIFKDSDKTYLMEDDLRGKTKDELALARNEIFARHGYVFTDETYKKYFSSKSWYTPNSSYDGSDSALNQYEIANYKVIQNWENK
ncbi:YARHG domain-containing protein [Clostridium saccharobutylicum]|uniref:YARHG domain-containing protein n=1 Tax=Clostridium saccharobutylicum TaxID=169679 RepID=A0A1S8NIZ3_CLOSA|nr:YARHG domain-containing protein [Clostridium saccharobutylicum]OOM16454.1 hypothetical protein CLOSAC_07250 [Clostridium saccharobutylicum]